LSGGLFLNVNKTQTLVVGLRQVSEGARNARLLGITLDQRLTWIPHIENVCSKLSRVIYLLRNLKDLVPKHYLRMCYFAFFQSVYTYGLVLWGCAPDVQRVLLLQKKAIRIISSAAYLEHCKPLFINEKIMTVYGMVAFRLLMNVKKKVET
jgi:hypothetical protein